MSVKNQQHVFPNGDKLVLRVVTSFVDFPLAPIYQVSYMEKDGESYLAHQSERFISGELAVRAFEERLESENPLTISSVMTDIDRDWEINDEKRKIHQQDYASYMV